MLKVLIIIPAYNEQENIIKTVTDIQQQADQFDYIIVNDCSTDNTLGILHSSKMNFLNLSVNLGIGGGVQTGYCYALENEYDVAIQFDGDGQHDAQYLSRLIAPIEREQADVVIGSRFLEKEGFQSSVLRRAGIGFLSGLIHLLSGVKVCDVTSGMRAVNKKMIQEFARNYAQDYPEPEAILAAGMLGARIVEVPVMMRERQGGQSSIHTFKSVYYMVKVSVALFLERLSTSKRK